MGEAGKEPVMNFGMPSVDAGAPKDVVQKKGKKINKTTVFAICTGVLFVAVCALAGYIVVDKTTNVARESEKETTEEVKPENGTTIDEEKETIEIVSKDYDVKKLIATSACTTSYNSTRCLYHVPEDEAIYFDFDTITMGEGQFAQELAFDLGNLPLDRTQESYTVSSMKMYGVEEDDFWARPATFKYKLPVKDVVTISEIYAGQQYVSDNYAVIKKDGSMGILVITPIYDSSYFNAKSCYIEKYGDYKNVAFIELEGFRTNAVVSDIHYRDGSYEQISIDAWDKMKSCEE